jgi:uncharacterized membrane protein
MYTAPCLNLVFGIMVQVILALVFALILVQSRYPATAVASVAT